MSYIIGLEDDAAAVSAILNATQERMAELEKLPSTKNINSARRSMAAAIKKIESALAALDTELDQ